MKKKKITQSLSFLFISSYAKNKTKNKTNKKTGILHLPLPEKRFTDFFVTADGSVLSSYTEHCVTEYWH